MDLDSTPSCRLSAESHPWIERGTREIRSGDNVLASLGVFMKARRSMDVRPYSRGLRVYKASHIEDQISDHIQRKSNHFTSSTYQTMDIL